MRKSCKFISDNTPSSEPNTLYLSQRDDGDIELYVYVGNPQEHGVSFRASGSRLKNYAKVINLFSQIIDELNEERRIHDVPDYRYTEEFDAG